MAQHQLVRPDSDWTDKRKLASNDPNSHKIGKIIFTANATGLTTTIVGATANSGTNAIRPGEKGVIYTNAGVPRDATVVTVTTVATAASDTVTFSPAIATATASGDTFRVINDASVVDNASLDARLTAINGTLYSQAKLDGMTQNDKIYALRLNDDALSF